MVKTKIVAILNITPDSFSDGGKYNNPNTAIEQLKILLRDGADMIDIGAESTRPGHIPISPQEEWQRLEHILPQVIVEVKRFNQEHHTNITTSIDTRHYETAKKAYEMGVDLINDVDGLIDERTIDLIAQHNIPTILMHNLAVKPVPNILVNEHTNLTLEIIRWARKKITSLQQRGVKRSQLIFDVGIGFGKTQTQAIRILKHINAYRSLGLPLYVGHSKKRFLDEIDFGAYQKKGQILNREDKTLIISNYLIEQDVDYIRVHDVASHRQLFQ